MKKPFKNFLLFTTFFASTFCLMALAQNKSKVIWIDEHDEFKSTNNSELRKRIHKLERAVHQLQKRVFELEYQNPEIVVPEKPKKYTCYIEVRFEGMFSETRDSLTEAKAAAVKLCAEKTNNSMHCKIDKVKCGE